MHQIIDYSLIKIVLFSDTEYYPFINKISLIATGFNEEQNMHRLYSQLKTEFLFRSRFIELKGLDGIILIELIFLSQFNELKISS